MSDATGGPQRPPLLVFTDLDGSLLDHHSYDWQPAAPWLERLAAAGVPVIPTTSKTRAELLALRRELALEHTRSSPRTAPSSACRRPGSTRAWIAIRLRRKGW
ncbi:hypothetical protein [Salinicola tamaricis]|uniref:hypothetical protein n=1 Tax=Salinicola tamaricis TaxID=1771309 RepID=UPI0030F397CA